MNSELPFAPIDSIIREADPNIKVGSDAPKKLAKEIQEEGSEKAKEASEIAKKNDRKTLMLEDLKKIGIVENTQNDLIIPLAPVDRIARLKIEDFRVSEEARKGLAHYLENWSLQIARDICKIARHAGRKTVKAEDVEIYFEIYNR